MLNWLSKNRILFGFIVSLVATSGSLYLSEVKKFVPCELCWYQRILMYPMVILLGIAFYKKDEKIAQYVKPIAMLGFLIAGYHYLKQKTTLLDGIGTCSIGVPCNQDYINIFGFITIPFLSLLAFFFIFLLFSLKKNEK